MDIGTIASTVGNVASGGVLGGIFSLGNAAVDFVNKRQAAQEALNTLKESNSHEIEMAKLAQAAAAANATATDVQTRLQGTIDEIKASFEGLKSSIEDQNSLDQQVKGPILDVIALFRPGLTVMLVLGAISTAFLQDQTPFATLSTLSGMSVAWWFGDRQRMKLMGR